MRGITLWNVQLLENNLLSSQAKRLFEGFKKLDES